ARAARRAICFLGLRAYFMARRKQAVKGGAVSEPYYKHFFLGLRGCRLSERRRPKVLKKQRGDRTLGDMLPYSHAGGHRFESCRAHHLLSAACGRASHLEIGVPIRRPPANSEFG